MENETFQILEKAVRDLERSVPPPKLVKRGNSLVYKYTEETIQQALVLKSFRVVSGLRAIQILRENRLHQEQHIIERVVDEGTEDIEFLILAIVEGAKSPLHEEYLKVFFFDPGMYPNEERQRAPSRIKVQKYIYNHAQREYGHKPYDKKDNYEPYGILSGFVHGNAPHIMDSFLGDPPRLQIQYEADGAVSKTFLNTYHIRISRGCIALQSIAAVLRLKPTSTSLEKYVAYWNAECEKI